MISVTLKAPLEMVRAFFSLSPIAVLRLNPSWHVQKKEVSNEGLCSMQFYDERLEKGIHVNLQVEVHEKEIRYIMDSNMIIFSLDELEPGKVRLAIAGDMFADEDLTYWLKGLENYMQLEVRRSKIIKLFLDSFWLRMTPAQRRIAIIVIVAEGIGLIVLIAVVIALRLVKNI